MSSLVDDNIVCLQQGTELLESLNAEQFTYASNGVFGSTIGGHLRHAADHFRCFLNGYASGRIDYDARERDTKLEEDPAYARQFLEAQIDALRQINEAELDRSVEIKMDAGETAEWSRSTVRRELQFLLSHTIHHFALIVAVGHESGLERFPKDFGVAPSTSKYRMSRN